jgi:hypothetical protein
VLAEEEVAPRAHARGRIDGGVEQLEGVAVPPRERALRRQHQGHLALELLVRHHHDAHGLRERALHAFRRAKRFSGFVRQTAREKEQLPPKHPHHRWVQRAADVGFVSC